MPDFSSVAQYNDRLVDPRALSLVTVQGARLNLALGHGFGFNPSDFAEDLAGVSPEGAARRIVEAEMARIPSNERQSQERIAGYRSVEIRNVLELSRDVQDRVVAAHPDAGARYADYSYDLKREIAKAQVQAHEIADVVRATNEPAKTLAGVLEQYDSLSENKKSGSINAFLRSEEGSKMRALAGGSAGIAVVVEAKPMTTEELKGAIKSEATKTTGWALLPEDARAAATIRMEQVDAKLNAIRAAADIGLKGYEPPTSVADLDEKYSKVEKAAALFEKMGKTDKSVPLKGAISAVEKLGKVSDVSVGKPAGNVAQAEVPELSIAGDIQDPKDKWKALSPRATAFPAAPHLNSSPVVGLNFASPPPRTVSGEDRQRGTKASLDVGVHGVDAANAPTMGHGEAMQERRGNLKVAPKEFGQYSSGDQAHVNQRIPDGLQKEAKHKVAVPSNDAAVPAPAAQPAHEPAASKAAKAGGIPANVKAQVKGVAGSYGAMGAANALTAATMIGADVLVNGKKPTLADAKSVAEAAATAIPGVATILAPAGKEKRLTGEIEAVTVATVTTTTGLGAAAGGVGAVPGALVGVGLSSLYGEARRLQEGCLDGEVQCGPVTNAVRGMLSFAGVSGGQHAPEAAAPAQPTVATVAEVHPSRRR
jgi:hypothetical protein